MIVLVGKTCSGKSTVADFLEQQYLIHRVRTYTTRPPRDGETDEYYFISNEEFDRMKADGEFFETTQYTVANDEVWRYGTGKEGFCRDCCIVMNPEGMKKVRNLLPAEYEPTIVYLNVSEGVQWNRLRERGQDADEARRRMDADKADFVDVESYYDVAINTDKLKPYQIANMVYNFATNY